MKAGRKSQLTVKEYIMVKLEMIFLFSVQVFFDPFATKYHFAAFSYSIMDMLLLNIYQLLI